MHWYRCSDSWCLAPFHVNCFCFNLALVRRVFWHSLHSKYLLGMLSRTSFFFFFLVIFLLISLSGDEVGSGISWRLRSHRSILNSSITYDSPLRIRWLRERFGSFCICCLSSNVLVNFHDRPRISRYRMHGNSSAASQCEARMTNNVFNSFSHSTVIN